jgi:hypothetical protein
VIVVNRRARRRVWSTTRHDLRGSSDMAGVISSIRGLDDSRRSMRYRTRYRRA